MMNLQRVEFVKSAAQAGAFLHDGLPQIAFAGKSNVGKSSVLNCVLQRKNFARVGQKPGKTVHINYVGPVIGNHSGPGTMALFFLGSER